MTVSPSSSAQGARDALAVRLQHLRKDAGLTGRELSARCGWHPAKTTRLQKGATPPSDADIRTWCAACGAQDRADDLIATACAIDSMYLEWRRLHRVGIRKVQQDWYALHEQTRVGRVYVSNVPPGFFQTPGFATSLMQQITAFQARRTTSPRRSRPGSPALGSSTRAAIATSWSWRSPSCASAPPTPTPCAGSCATSWR
jgi:transcriptional regulator with XRE-family HTH domain